MQTFESLWANIHKKRERIKRGSGERMRKPGEKGAPTAAQSPSNLHSLSCKQLTERPNVERKKKNKQIL